MVGSHSLVGDRVCLSNFGFDKSCPRRDNIAILLSQMELETAYANGTSGAGAGGGFYCENCVRDAMMLRQLCRLGHDAIALPMYLPAGPEQQDIPKGPLFFGVSMSISSRNWACSGTHRAGWMQFWTHPDCYCERLGERVFPTSNIWAKPQSRCFRGRMASKSRNWTD